jgi:hypothetical protein
MFPDKVDGKVKKLARNEPYREIKCRHIIIPEDEYDLPVEKKGRRNRLPFTSILIDVEHDTILEEVPAKRLSYVIPALGDGCWLAVRLFAVDRGCLAGCAFAPADDADHAGGRPEGCRPAAKGNRGGNSGRRQHVCRRHYVG